jgi:energy-coupling factor transporter transmembrane protein EcfT
VGHLTAIGFAPGRSPLHRLDPRTKQALLMALGVVSLWGSFPFLVLLTGISLYGFRAARIRWVRLVMETRFFLFFILFIFAVRTIRFEGVAVPSFNGDLAGDALLVCWRLLLVVLMALLLMVTTRTAHIRAALVWYLKPIPLIDEKMAATMVGLVVRFLPRILLQGAEISDAQQARCVALRRNPLVRLKHFSVPLFRRVFLSADELVAAMQARCYSDNRTLPELNFSRRDAVAVAVATLISLTSFFP